jgi:hypothetical protein
VIAAALLLGGGTVAGQPARQRETAQASERARKDSIATLRSLRNRKQLFHQALRFAGGRLRFETPSGRGTFIFRCPIQVGSYCVDGFHDETVVGSPPGPLDFLTQLRRNPPDASPRATRVIDEYLADIDKMLDKQPGDYVLSAERARVLIGTGRLSQAADTTACRGERWWCAALAGHALHIEKKYVEANDAFSVALREMPDAERCAWHDLADLFEGEEKDVFDELPCDARAVRAERLWWLADPLYLVPGNERRSEHFSRLMRDLISLVDTTVNLRTFHATPAELRAHRPFPSRGVAYETLVLRYGVPVGFVNSSIAGRQPIMYQAGFLGPPPANVNAGITSRPRKVPRDVSYSLLLAQYYWPRYHFLPDASIADDPTSAEADAWQLDKRKPAEFQTTLNFPYTALEHQAAVFRRGDSALLVVATDTERDSLLRGGLTRAGFVLARNEHDTPRVVQAHSERRYVFNVMSDTQPRLASLEVIALGGGAGRARFGIGPPPMPAQRITLSDILLADSGTALPTDLDQARARIRYTTRIDATEPVTLFWEVYGLAAGEVAAVTLTSTRLDTTALRRFGRLLGIVAQATGLRLGWEDPAGSGAAITPRSVVLDVRQLPPGRYALELAVRVPGQQPASVTRIIDVTP